MRPGSCLPDDDVSSSSTCRNNANDRIGSPGESSTQVQKNVLYREVIKPVHDAFFASHVSVINTTKQKESALLDYRRHKIEYRDTPLAEHPRSFKQRKNALPACTLMNLSPTNSKYVDWSNSLCLCIVSEFCSLTFRYDQQVRSYYPPKGGRRLLLTGSNNSGPQVII